MRNIASPSTLVNTRNLRSTCDARKITRPEQIGLRKRAFSMLDKLNFHPMQIAACLCVAGRTVYRWIEAEAAGLRSVLTTSLKPKRTSKLSLEQIQTIRLVVSSSLPTDHGFQTLLRTRKLVADLCRKMFGISLSKSTVGRTLRSLKLSYQKPIRKAYQQDPDKVEQYCDEVIPALFQKAQAEDADVYFLDEATVRSDPCNGKTWGTQGQTPLDPQDGKQHRTNVIGVLSLKGESQFLVYEQRTDADLLITFIDELMRTKQGKVYLILDNARYHHAKKVHEHLRTHYQERLTLIYRNRLTRHSFSQKIKCVGSPLEGGFRCHVIPANRSMSILQSIKRASFLLPHLLENTSCQRLMFTVGFEFEKERHPRFQLDLFQLSLTHLSAELARLFLS